MNDPSQTNNPVLSSPAEKIHEPKHPPKVSKSAPGAEDHETTTEPGVPSPADQLTPEEQMRLFEKELKEQDWGHQPC